MSGGTGKPAADWRPNAVGRPIKRREDPRLIRGLATYTDDIKRVDMLHAAFVRSDFAAGRIQSIDLSVARAAPGVVAAFTFEDLKGTVGPTPSIASAPFIAKEEHPLLADGDVRFVGQPVAVVLAETAQQAADAKDLVVVDIEPREAVTDVRSAMADDAPKVYPELPSNICFRVPADHPRTDELFRAASGTFEVELSNQRVAPVPMEGRAVVAEWDEGPQKLTVFVSTQTPHHVKQQVASCLGVPEINVRAVAPEVGGGFGCKIPVYPEECLLSWVSKALQRPVKWCESRSENLLATTHGRGHLETVEVAHDEAGRVLALRGRTVAEVGAYCSYYGPFIALSTYSMACGCYDIGAVSWETVTVYTNTMATEAYRGAGRPEAAYLIERIMDELARRLELDPVEVRRRNFIARDAFPYTTATGSTYDSGDYDRTLDRALGMFDYRGSRKAQREGRLRFAALGGTRGHLTGIGIATFTEVCGLGPSSNASPLERMGTWESATVRVEPSGNVTVLTGISPHGQGEETSFAQMVSDAFGVPVEAVTVVHGDTDVVQHGVGTFGSRGIAVGGAALHMSLVRIHAKARRIAAHHLDVPVERIAFDAGVFRVAGSDDSERALHFRDVAQMAHLWNTPVPGEEPGLEAVARFEPTGATYPFGAHLCEVKVDVETGAISLERYVATDDFGNVINPLLSDGQRIGGIVQGIGQALWEEVRYDDGGQLVTGSLMDYALPRAPAFPRFELANTVTTTPLNPLGAKGIGELGTIGATPCVVNAVIDALEPLGITHLDMPLAPGRVRLAIEEALEKARA